MALEKAERPERGPSQTGSWKAGAFGDTDASRSNALLDYIEIDGVVPSLRRTAEPLRYRFIVGRKGSGKTHYLKALRQHLRSSEFYILQQIEALPTDDVVLFTRAASRFHAKMIDDSEIYVDPQFYVRDFWRLAWDRAIYGSVASVIVRRRVNPQNDADRSLAAILTQADLERLRRFLPDTDEVRSPAGALSAFMQRHTSFNRVRRFLHHPDWTFTRGLIEAAISAMPPLVIIIDSLDDDFEASPEAWLQCQDGLFKAMIGQLNAVGTFGNRVHVIAAIRDVVYSSLLRSDHALRYVEDSHIFHIRWDYRACRTFLDNKISSIAFTPKTTDEPTLASWIGKSTIANRTRGRPEPVEQYLLRHTRLIPRDIVFLGNALSRALDGHGSVTESVIEKTTHDVARLLATESMRTSVNEALMSREYVSDILRQMIDPTNSNAADRPLLNTTGGDLREWLFRKVSDFFVQLASEKFGFVKLKEAMIQTSLATEDDFAPGRLQPYRFDHILWRQGMIAYRDRLGVSGSWRYFTAGTFESFLLPDDAPEYGLHSVLIDLYPSIKVAGNSEPVL